MTSVKRLAKQDAHEFARAEMYYGRGAGTRRKLIHTTVDHRAETIPGYEAAFRNAVQKQDMADHAEKARKERHRKDVHETIERNIRALKNGERRSSTNSVFVLSVLAIVAYRIHEEGLDKQAFEWTKVKYRKGKVWAKRTIFMQKMEKHLHDNVHNITVVTGKEN